MLPVPMLLLACALAALLAMSVVAQAEAIDAPRTTFVNAASWPDTKGQHINVHGGGILFHEGVYYWYGESRGEGWRTDGVGVYTSTDLYNWTSAGLAFKVIEDDADHPARRGTTLEQPKVVYNAHTKKFVMWWHLERPGARYGDAWAAVATGDSPTGPFTYLRAGRVNANRWPENFDESLRSPLDGAGVKAVIDEKQYRPAVVEGVYTRRDFAGGQMSRDMTIFVDPDDQKAYLITSGEENYTLHLHELTDDYLSFTGRWIRIGPGGHNEAPAIVKRHGKYLVLTSGCTGWDPNAARQLLADSIWGPWTQLKNPCIGDGPAGGAAKTFGGQSTFILPVPGKPDGYIAMFDVWRPNELRTSGHIWLPIEFDGDRMRIQWHDRWDMSVFDPQ